MEPVYKLTNSEELRRLIDAHEGGGKIYEANKDRVRLVGNSPMIYEKQWLVIPQ